MDGISAKTVERRQTGKTFLREVTTCTLVHQMGHKDKGWRGVVGGRAARFLASENRRKLRLNGCQPGRKMAGFFEQGEY